MQTPATVAPAKLTNNALIYAAIILVAYAASAGITTVYSMLAVLYREFTDTSYIGWVPASYWLVGSVLAAICGRLGDALGRRRVAIVLLAIAGVGSLVSAQATSLAGIILGCALQGTTAALTPLSLGIVSEAFAREKVPTAVGIVTAAGMTSAGVSFMVAGYFIDEFTWRGGFYMKIALVLIAILGLLAFVPRSPARPESLKGIKPLGVILFAPAVAGIFIALQLGKDRGWSSILPLTVLVASFAMIAYWVWDQSRSANPLIDVRSFARRPILFGNLSIALLAMGGFQMGQITSLVLQVPKWTGAGFGLTAFMSGLSMACLNTVSLVASPLSGSLSLRVGVRPIAVTGALVMSLAWLTLTFYRPSVLVIIICIVPLMVGMAMLQAAAYIAIVQATDPSRTSEATGMSYIFLNLFIAIGGQICFLLLATDKVADPSKGPGTFPTHDSMTLAYGFVTVVSALGVLVAAMIPKFITPTSR